MEDSPESMPMALREDDKPEPSFTPILAENACLINCFAAVPNEDCTACGPCLPNTEAGCKNAAFIFDRDTWYVLKSLSAVPKLSNAVNLTFLCL